MGSESPASPLQGWTYRAPGHMVRSLLQDGLLFPLVRYLSPITLRGREHLDGVTGPVIVAANHVSHLDTPIVLMALPRPMRRRLVVAAAKDYFYSGRVKGTLVSLALATYPFDRGKGSADSLAQTQALLNAGWSLLIFPEGTRSPSGELGRVRTGVAVLASSCSVPVVPMFVHGLAKVMPKGTAAPLPGGVVIDIDEPIRPQPDEDVLALRDRIEHALTSLQQRSPKWGATKPT